MSVSNEWEQLLLPDATRNRLISASMYITTFELLKDSIVGRIRGFYFIGLDKNSSTSNPDYQREVLSRNKSVLYASLDWLIEIAAIHKSDIEAFERLKTVRNKLAHELPSIVLGGAELQLTTHFEEALALLRKMEVWWIVNVEIATNPDYDRTEVDESGIIPGPVLMLQLMLDVVAGNSEYLDHYRRAAPSRKTEI